MAKNILSILTILLLVYAPLSAQQESYRNAHTHAEKAYELFDAGQYRPAIEEFTKARELADPKGMAEIMRLDYYLAESAARIGDRNAMERLNAFLEDYPGSAYANDVSFAKGNLYYLEKDYNRAREEYGKVNVYELRTSQQDEYNFKLGHTLFMQDNLSQADIHMKNVNRNGEYGVHARYYSAYIDYVSGRYYQAKQEFQQLADNPSYEKIIPFYLLQIEFLEGNYGYVTREGDKLLNIATGERETEIARIMGEAWFHNGDYERALSYMGRYRSTGGRMGRAENYLVGYSQYMRNDISDAINSLSQVVGPDDRLTQNAAYHLGGSYLSTGDKYRAMQSFSMASGANHDDAIREDALFNYGKLQYELGGGVFNEAINILQRYITEYPNSQRVDEAREYLIAAYYNSHNYEAAYEAIKQVPNPDNNIKTAYQKIAYFRALEYYNTGEMDRAYDLFEESLRNRFNPKYTALTQFWKGEILYRKGDYSRSIPLYQEYLSLSTPSEREYQMAEYNIGYAYFNQKRYGDARTWFDRFLRNYSARDNFRADVLNRLGDANFAQREFSKAVENYEAAAAIGTEDRYYSRFRRALALGLAGSNTRKIDGLRDIINSGDGPYVPDAMYELGRTYIGMERFSDGAGVLKQLVDRYPNSDVYLSALSDLGLAYQNMNDNRSALNYYQTLVNKAPSSPQARDAMLAVKSIYVDMNDVDGYFAFASRTGVDTETGAVARDSLSYAAAERVYMTSNDTGRSIAALKDYLDKFPRGAFRPNGLYNISEAYLAAGQTDNAIRSLNELSELYYNSFTVRGLEKLAPLAFQQRQYQIAAGAYKKLAGTSVNPQTIGNGWSGYLRSVRAQGDDAALLAAANEVLAATGVPTATQKEAKYIKAQALSQRGDESGAIALYQELATEVQSEEGAASTYHVIEFFYRNGDPDAAETAVLDFAGKNSPHSYWLGRAFLILGDVYVDKGDTFQARATLQSIVDGYSPADDGVIAGARERISRLGTEN